MSFKQNHIIHTGNYEEYFILYMDNELNAEQKQAVENFVAQHPHLQEELDLLMSTKLPLDEMEFSGKQELLSASMKMNLVDESLLLYIDNELPASEKNAVEEKIKTDKDYALQHSVLMQTKLDASEEVLYPNKKELYRHTERVIAFKLWMRVAAAIILLLLSSVFFLTNRNEKLPDGTAVVTIPSEKINNSLREDPPTAVEELINSQAPVQQVSPVAKTEKKKEENPASIEDMQMQEKASLPENKDVAFDNNIEKSRQAVRFDVNRSMTTPTITEPIVNNTITRTSVTSKYDSTYNKQNNPMNNPEADWAVETEKKTPAKGFFRKVSRFIERNTGIGTVNADNELLIGAVALKLK